LGSLRLFGRGVGLFVGAPALAGAIVLLAGEAAWGNCSPQSQSGVIATCTGSTLNQGLGPENTSADVNGFGYGTVSHVGITVSVDNNASVTGTAGGIVGNGLTVTNNTGATITGFGSAINSWLGSANVTNSGTITSPASVAISGNAGATVINNTGATINGGEHGIVSYDGDVDVTNSGSITGITDDAIQAWGSVTTTNNTGGSITGGRYGIRAVTGAASIFNAGTITGGTAAIYLQTGDSTLTLGPGSTITGGVVAVGSNTFQLGGTGTATFDVSVLDTQYVGFTTFNKISNSVWTLTGASTYTGPVNVNAGRLIVDGNISSVSLVTVNAGATLSGNGVVGSTTVNAGGTLAPGNSTALLTVQGSLTFAAASSYMIEVSPASATRTDATGEPTSAA
jgi:autotransporter-associated beta strand protein